MKRQIKFKRRIEKKTNYRRRLGLLKSDRIRVVIRKSLDNISVQFVNFNPKGDETVASAVSAELKKLGWKRTGNIPAAYLTGLLAGKKAKEKKVTEAVLDLGIQTSTKGSRIYAALKGAVDAGISIPHSKDILPSDDRVKGKHISEEVAKLFEDVKKKIGV
jgi:large subunit ribosomal protein L18